MGLSPRTEPETRSLGSGGAERPGFLATAQWRTMHFGFPNYPLGTRIIAGVVENGEPGGGGRYPRIIWSDCVVQSVQH